MTGGGAWKLRYVDEDLRIMDTVVVRAEKEEGRRRAPGRLADPARFMEDPDW